MKTYELIPLSEITPEAREIAVAWIEGYEPMGFDIQQKHKLASDIMNYAAGQVSAERERIKKQLEKLYKDMGTKDMLYELQSIIDSL